MSKDIVFPGDCKNLLKMAKLVGYDALLVVAGPDEKTGPVFIADAPNNKMQALIRKYAMQGRMTIAKATSEQKLRFLVEKTKISLVYGMEYLNKGDHLHFRKSGLNQVICQIAKRNNIIFGFSFADWLQKKSPQVLGKLRQNLLFSRKYKIPYFIGSFTSDPQYIRNPKDLKGLAESLVSQPFLTFL